MKLRLIRHATLWIEYAGKKILVDPMFSDQGTYPGLPVRTRSRGPALRNPLVPLPFPAEDLGRPDVIVVTHLHFDHLDKRAAARLPKDVPLVCRPGDRRHLRDAGFTALVPCARRPVTCAGIDFHRTDAKHGRGWVGMIMGRPCGFVFRAPGEPVLYLAGDTVFYRGLVRTLHAFRPEVVVANAGAATFSIGDPITMNAEDVVLLARTVPQANIVAVHLEALNHCRLTRAELAEEVKRAGVGDRVFIPADGEFVDFTRPAGSGETV